ncbi:MAG TPA: sigma 54-interacting transcriptional regulator [Vicinamibacterales bacterium]|nr:sigma 54-interacting transcriptional regulator [Vicinamibacterales bacterium]
MIQHSVLAAVARLVSEESPLDRVLSGVALLLRDAIPFERLHVLRLDRSDSVTLYVVGTTGEVEVTGHMIADAEEAQPHPGDGTERSRLICTVREGARVKGAVWLTSGEANAFNDEHQELLEGVGDLITLALYHDTVRTTDLRRTERIDALVRLLHTVAETLDIRQIFPQLSDTVRGALPHDILALTSWADDGLSFRVYAMAGADIPDEDFWAPTLVPPLERTLLDRKAYIIHDVGSEIAAETVRGRLLRMVGARSALRVAIPLGNAVFGSLFFLARDPGRFSDEDIDFARRVGDHLGLALSHQHLAEAARRDAAARENAARLEAQVATLTRELESRTGQRRVVGQSRQWQDVLAHAARVAQAETTVLLTGESGTGKEVVARFIHHASRRGQGSFVAINCAALPDQLLESELFGYERGAFTGAVAVKPGRIEQANGGVLFLDEVGEMAPTVQAKLLRVLEEREFQRLGGTRLHHADIRVIAATNRDLHAAMQRGGFREDLYYRLGVFEIELPPLRDRAEDVLELADMFLREIGETVGRPAAGFEREARRDLLNYPWPGNVRELRNAIERAVILADGGYIRSEHLPVNATRKTPSQVEPSGAPLPAGGVNLDAIERSLVIKALNQARHNKTRAAKLLGLTRAQLYSRIEKYGLAETES